MKIIECAQSLVQKGDEFLKKHGPLQFHEKASQLLSIGNLCEAFDFKELVEASMSPSFNHKQNFASIDFSDLPITLMRGEQCFLDIYFWRRRPTVIHNHHFIGAFQCLEGINKDLEFEFKSMKKLGHYHEHGILNLVRSRELKKGDIAEIDLLDKFIHQNHHQADLTINACFRIADFGETYLSEYLYSGLRMEKNKNLIQRTSRLMSLIHLGDFNLDEIDLTIDDMISFLVLNYRTESKNLKLLKMIHFMDLKIKKEVGLDVAQLLKVHELEISKLEDEYC